MFSGNQTQLRAIAGVAEFFIYKQKFGPLTCAALSTLMVAQPISAQETPPPPASEDDFAIPGDLDPDAPLPAMPDLEVEWPDLDVPLPKPPELPTEDAPPPAEPTVAAAGAPVPPVPPVAVALTPPDLALPAPLLTGEANEQVATESVTEDATLLELDGQWRYRVELATINGVDQAALTQRFLLLSALRAAQRNEANTAQITRRILEDTDLLQQILRNAGHFDASVAHVVDRADTTLTVRFSAEAGPSYRYDAVTLDGLVLSDPVEQDRLRAAFPVQPGQVIVTEALLAAQLGLRETLLETGYPFGVVGQELVTVDHDTRLGDLLQPVTPGRRLRFGAIRVNDSGMFGARHLGRIARFDPGEWYRQSDVEDLRRAVIATGLVARAEIEAVEGPGETVDIAVTVEPAPLRTISGGLGFGTGEGFRAEIGWEHRNLFPPEGALILRGVAGTQEQLASITFRRNNFMRRDRILTFQGLVSHVDRAAFEANTALFTARLERQSTLLFQKRWIWSVGAEFVATDERDQRRIAGAGRQTFFVGALPLFLGHDRSDDLLNPSSGWRASVRLSPEVSLRGDAFTYVRAQVDGSAYWPVRDGVVLAGRMRLGTIAGSVTEGIAPSRRYYAGGGGSVRGYGYQAVGPRDAFGDPFGGRSLFEMATEARIRLPWLEGALSIVPFIDAGNVYQTQYPDFSGLRVGAGVGVRYLTNFGPIRVDVGTPLTPRSGDSRIAVYVSLGQAF